LLKPASENLKSEPEIIGRIADAYFKGNHPVNWLALSEDYTLLREKLSAVISDFKGLETKSKGSGFYLPNNVRELDFSKLPDGKAQFSNCELPKHNLQKDEFLMMTVRTHDQFNTTIYGMNDRYRGIYNERRVVLMNPADIQKLGCQPLDVIDIISEYDGVTRKAENFKLINYNIPKGNVASYFPETNILVPHNHYAKKSNTPISKSVVVKFIKK